MADVINELTNLRPVYEKGVLRMLLRKNSDVYIAMLRACFNPLTAEIPQERLLSDMTHAIGELVTAGDYQLKEGEDDRAAAQRILKELKSENNEGDYAWIADSLDRRQHHLMCRLTQRAHRAIEAVATLQTRTVSLSGAQVNSIIMEIDNARKQLTVSAEDRIQILEQEIKERKAQIKELKANGAPEKPTPDQVSDIINVVYNTLRGVPVDLRELVVTERDNGDELRRHMDNGSLHPDEMLGYYEKDYKRTYLQSDEGRRFQDAFQIMNATASREQLDKALQDITQSEWLEGEADDLMTVVSRELNNIYDGIHAVRSQVRVTDESVKLLVRQQSDMRFRSLSRQLSALFTKLGTVPRNTGEFDLGLGNTSLPSVPDRARAQFNAAEPPQLSESKPTTALDLNNIIATGGPRILHMVTLVAADPVLHNGLVDIPASFNQLPAHERRESELVGFLSYLGEDGTDGTGEQLWHCVGTDGSTRTWHTRALLVPPEELNDFISQTA